MKLVVKDLEKTYLQGSEKVHVLRGLQLTAEEAEVVAVLGKSGSGKTTLLSLLAGLDQPNSGQIILGNTILSSMSEDERTEFRGRQIGIVFQSYHLVPHLTALENVMLPLEIMGVADSAKKSKELLDAVGLSHRLGHVPSRMSGGECQRTALARALVSSPKILLADEPSGHLDQETGQIVMDLFFRLVRQMKTTTLLVTHDPVLADQCDRKIVLKSGMILA